MPHQGPRTACYLHQRIVRHNERAESRINSYHGSLEINASASKLFHFAGCSYLVRSKWILKAWLRSSFAVEYVPKFAFVKCILKPA